jgi:hypothetical protein
MAAVEYSRNSLLKRIENANLIVKKDEMRKADCKAGYVVCRKI